MRHIYRFQNDGFKYQAVELPSLNRVQIWQKAPWSDTWELGHSKAIPEHGNAETVVRAMMALMLGAISIDDYNAELPA